MPTYVKIGLGITLAALLVLSGWMVRGLYEDSVQLQVERVVNAVNEIKGQAIAAINIENKTIYNKTVEKVTSEIQYRECKQDAEMLMLTNRALTGR